MPGNVHFQILGQREPKVCRQGDDLTHARIAHRLCAVANDSWSILDRCINAVHIHARRVEQHGEPRCPLHQGANRGTAQVQDEVALPVTPQRKVCRLEKALAVDPLLTLISIGAQNRRRQEVIYAVWSDSQAASALEADEGQTAY